MGEHIGSMKGRDGQQDAGGGDRRASCCGGGGGGGGIVAGLVVAALGVLLLLRELEMLPNAISIWGMWPLILVGIGLGHAGKHRSVAGILFGLVLAALGAALLLGNLGILEVGIWQYWPVLIVLAGVAIMFGGARHRSRPHLAAEQSSEDYLIREVKLGGAQIRVESKQFRGGQLSATMGGIELDLRHAEIEGDEAVLDFHLTMGGVEMRVPETWRVVDQVVPTLGGVENKTVPALVPGGTPKRLVLRGTVCMGAISVRN
jgi:predicted membrane protein